LKTTGLSAEAKNPGRRIARNPSHCRKRDRKLHDHVRMPIRNGCGEHTQLHLQKTGKKRSADDRTQRVVDVDHLTGDAFLVSQ
jgi:ribosomal protein L32